MLFLILSFAGCKYRSTQTMVLASDTVEVFQLALRAALIEHELPEINSLFRSDLFRDSVLVDVDSFPKRLFPATLGRIKFKFGSYQQIADQLGKVPDSSKPNYLYLCCFQKVDSIYSVSVQSRSDIRFGGGGSMYAEIVKRDDSLVVKHVASNSIN